MTPLARPPLQVASDMLRPAPFALLLCLALSLFAPTFVAAQDAAARESSKSAGDDATDRLLRPLDVFQLEFAADPRIAPGGDSVVYVRTFFDILKDRRRTNLWVATVDGKSHRPLTTGLRNDSAPRWSPDGARLAYLSSVENGSQIYVRWMDSGDVAKVTNVQNAPSDLAWSPDGKWLAFTMLVPESSEPLAKLPPKPEGAEWAESMKVIRQLNYRADGAGYLKEGYTQVFVVPADGGTPRQLTRGPFEHSGPLAWSPDGRAILFSGNRDPDWELQPLEEEILEVDVRDGTLRALTKRAGPDRHPTVSPDGRSIAYLGFDDRRQGYQVVRLYVMDRDGGRPRCVSANIDRDLAAPEWSRDGRSIYCQFDDRGVTKAGRVRLDDKLTTGTLETLAEGIGGSGIGRPYPSGSFSVAADGRIAFAYGTTSRPADVAVVGAGDAKPRTLTNLNGDLLDAKTLGRVQAIEFKSSADGLPIQAWLVQPPNFDARKKYPLLLEIHGGPFANYGERFSAEMQLYAAAGYVVLYVNPRGSTSYGQAFGNAIHHAYPGLDYDDLMSGVDEALKTGYVDPDNLFVTGGSGGGVLTAWIVGKTKRFRAAVSAKPVINWYSFALTADKYAFFSQYWFPGPPWEHAEHYLKRSPLSLVGAVSTPTMLITGEQDYRTPISESEQFYQALKLRKIDAALVRVPGAAHDISARPSHLIGQVAHTLAWFEKYRKK